MLVAEPDTSGAFNRTNVELKFIYLAYRSPSLPAFNRTNVELKSVSRDKICRRGALLIVPLWN